MFRNALNRRYFATVAAAKVNHLPEKLSLNVDYLCDPKNTTAITHNISIRKGYGDIKKVLELKTKLDSLKSDSSEYDEAYNAFSQEALKIPNLTHPDVLNYGDNPKVIKTVGEEKKFDFKPRQFDDIGKRLNLLRTDQLGTVCGSRSYYFIGELVELENALIHYTLTNLLKRKFKLFSVPDILDRNVVEGCGFKTTGERHQVYFLDDKHGKDLCLSGTSEMAFAGYFANKILPHNQLPYKVTTASRCYRAETSNIAEEKGIYRVHEFTKVEMFSICLPEQSENLLEEFRSIEEENFASLGLHLRTLDMPPSELGAPAYRKYDVEVWMHGRKYWGEISSCSNCTDYQTRRLNIQYKDHNDELQLCHTVNGTACAVPRMLIAILEQYQNDNGTIDVPEVLWKYMRGKKKISKQKNIPPLKLVKNKKSKT